VFGKRFLTLLSSSPHLRGYRRRRLISDIHNGLAFGDRNGSLFKVLMFIVLVYIQVLGTMPCMPIFLICLMLWGDCIRNTISRTATVLITVRTTRPALPGVLLFYHFHSPRNRTSCAFPYLYQSHKSPKVLIMSDESSDKIDLLFSVFRSKF
jgi:hypothetical protein